MNRSDKMVVLLEMLERGQERWMDPITDEEVAPFFYDYLHAEKYRELKDAQTAELKGTFDATKVERLLKKMPFPKMGRPFVFEKNKLTISTVDYASNDFYKMILEIVRYRMNLFFAKKGN
jgi:hypothetical protein